MSIVITSDGSSEDEIVKAITFGIASRDQHMRFQTERLKAEALNSMGFLGKDDIVWAVASGPFGAEIVAYSIYAGQSIGIDPSFPTTHEINNCVYIKKTIEEVIEDLSVPRPTLVVSNNYSGMHSVLRAILDMETEPTCMISLCNCEPCKEKYYRGILPKSKCFAELFSGASYTDLNEKNPADADVYDMAEIAKEAGGYKTAIFGVPAGDMKEYMIAITKNQDLLNFVAEGGAQYLLCRD